MTGKIIGVGVGPGDPELLTLKALKIIREAKVIAYPSTETGESFARSIVKEFMPKDVQEIPIKIPMVESRFPSQLIYNSASDEIAIHLECEVNVVILCQGDPFFYGSFMYLFSRFAGKYPVEIIPGISSLNACSAVAQRPLCSRLESLSVIPGGMDDEAFLKQLEKEDAFAIMKVGRNIARIKRLLEQSDMAKRAVYVSHATLTNQLVLPLAEAPETAPYFSMILVPSKDEYVIY
ncbi:MAG: precorrin-2 C(20)-methyltransferase [Rhodobacteraceae bacterium]|nr:precorrin-2 C(20)-methyltransferase [Paracoccaceae bacterium]MCY4250647.1 precorrin-2 C(20)-methyltransferase [Paracoccaceae bacterium]